MEEIKVFDPNFVFAGDIPEEVIISDGFTSIPEDAFLECESLKSIVIPDSVVEIGNDAFRGCSALEYVKMPKTIKKWGSDIFYECPSLKSLVIPQGCEIIADNNRFAESLRRPDGFQEVFPEIYAGCY